MNKVNLVKMESKEIKTLMIQAGYDNAKALSESTNCKLSYESVRRTIQGQPVSTWTLFLVLEALNLPKQEVKRKMKQAGDKILTPYFGDSKDINPCDRAAMELFNTIMLGIGEHDRELLYFVMQNIAKKNGLDVTEQLEKLSEACDYTAA